MSKKIILMGKPGSGKGTQAKKASAYFGIPHISTGDLLRDQVARSTDLGKAIADIMGSGNFAPLELVIEVVRARLSEDDALKGFILDGFPRALDQAEALDKILIDLKTKIDAVVYIECSDTLVAERIINRRTCKCGEIYHLLAKPPKVAGLCNKCSSPLIHRSDDTEEVLKKRLSIFEKETLPVVKHYRQIASTIVGAASEELVFEQLKTVLEDKMS